MKFAVPVMSQAQTNNKAKFRAHSHSKSTWKTWEGKEKEEEVLTHLVRCFKCLNLGLLLLSELFEQFFVGGEALPVCTCEAQRHK